MNEAHAAVAAPHPWPQWLSGLLPQPLPVPPQRLLTARETEIARLVAEGLSSKRVGDRLGISEHTVRKHRENIARKLKLRNTAELVVWAVRHLELRQTA